MTRHYAYGLDITDLDVVVVDDSKPMQTILRSILLSFRVRRVRTFDSAQAALEVMRIDPPNLVITDWRMKPMSGLGLLRLMRQRRLAPLCFLPIIFVTAHGTRTLIDRVLRAGAQNVLVKPLSPASLYERLIWTLHDPRPLVFAGDGRYVIDGVADSLDAKAQKWRRMGAGRVVDLGKDRSSAAGARDGALSRAQQLPAPEPLAALVDARSGVALDVAASGSPAPRGKRGDGP